ncbi:hypothetical protein J42TS3_42960 [Paenibacillus vini]|uniref:Uncharacterized protein n=1 Tax=Paenibacillus vini TaxID=1476024 RepID=A0ABQ4MGZ2_9BACL|nr:hypothetical protein J42TS3_42960 [Paenibacillus vini]
MKFDVVDGKVALIFDEFSAPSLVLVSEDGVNTRLMIKGQEIPIYEGVAVTSRPSSPIKVVVSESVRVPTSTSEVFVLGT